MSREMSSQQLASAYQAGYRDGYCGKQARPENFPAQEEEYLKGHHKGWFDGYAGQPRPTI
jgi:hypothetical protein